MKTSAEGIKLIKNFEGVRLTAYKCPAGVWTIGYGHTGNVHQGMTITQAQADEFLKADLVRFEAAVTKTGLKLKQNQFDALVSFTYNCGQGCLQSLIKNRNLSQIANALLLYNKANGKIIQGLSKRRLKEREMFLNGTNENNKYKVLANSLNIRFEPNTSSKVVGTLKKDAIVTVYTENNGFAKIGDNKFVSLRYLKKI